ncbi:MAG TPA: 3-oxoadipate enol-lactonase [Streptosporangiaceae bacterium]|nr:3-oxoadipate enol-lactonase [Streptosporangiaceae bacterium]
MSEPPPAPASGSLGLTASLDGPPDAPVLVLGNSLGTTRAVWEPQLPAFGSHFRLLRYEHPGHGGSAAAPGPYSIEELGAGVLALLDSCGIERAAYCGISLGGMIGIWLAANAPERITALGLCCTSAYLPPASAWLERAGLVRSAGMRSVSRLVVSRWFAPAFADRQPAVPESFVAQFERTDPQGYAGCCEAIAGMDLRDSLGSISAPTLVIAGSEDPATPPAHGAVIAAGISGARLIVVRGAAHLANVSAAGQVTAALLGHVRAMA